MDQPSLPAEPPEPEFSADFRSLFEASPTPYLVMSPRDFTILAVNDAYLRATMAERDQLVGRRLFDVFPDNPDNPAADGVRNLRASLERVLARRRMDVMAVQRYDVRRPDGEFEVRYWSPINTPVVGPDGEITSIIHRVEDVTGVVQTGVSPPERREEFDPAALDPRELREANARLATEAALRRRVEADLRASEERFRHLADAMPHLVWISDDAGVPHYFNSRADEYRGLERGPDGSWRWESVIHPDDLEPTREAWREAVRRGATFECEHRVQRWDGSFRWHLSRAQRAAITDGAAEWYGTATDIHELKTADELKDQFLAIASHELRNPVAVVHGIAQQLQRWRNRGGLSEERLGTYVEALLDSTSFLARLTNDLMDVSRLQRGALPLEVEPVDLLALLEEVVARDDAGGRVRVHAAPGVSSVPADAHRIRQVIANLLDNALKYSPEEAPVLVRLLDEDGGARVEVIDRGIGLTEDALEAIFRPFERARNVGAAPGLGLGLYIAREIAERHGGSLVATSEGEGRGTTMVLRLPRHEG